MAPVRLVSITELQQRGAAIIAEVEAGKEIIITRTGHPVAVILPATEENLSFQKGGEPKGQSKQ